MMAEMTDKEWEQLSEQIKEEAHNINSPWFLIRKDEDAQKEVL